MIRAPICRWWGHKWEATEITIDTEGDPRHSEVVVIVVACARCGARKQNQSSSDDRKEG